MDQLCAGIGQHSVRPRVAKQVEYFAPSERSRINPMRRHVGKKPMAERRRLALKQTLPRAMASYANVAMEDPASPTSSSEPGTKVASDDHSSNAGAHMACGSGRTTVTGP